MIFEKNFARNYEKIIILGTSDAWSVRMMIVPSPQRIDMYISGLYYIEDSRIFLTYSTVSISKLKTL